MLFLLHDNLTFQLEMDSLQYVFHQQSELSKLCCLFLGFHSLTFLRSVSTFWLISFRQLSLALGFFNSVGKGYNLKLRCEEAL